MTRLVLQRSLREPGHIVNLGSVAGHWAYPNGATYITSKFAVRGFTRALREDLLGREIRVTTIDSGLGRDRVLGRALPRRRGEGEVRLRGDASDVGRRRRRTRSCTPSRGRRTWWSTRCCSCRSTSRAARASIARPEESPCSRFSRARPSASRTSGATWPGSSGGLFAQDTRRLSRFVLTINGAAPAAALVGPGRVLLGRVLPPQPAGRAAAGRALDRALALRRRRRCRSAS